MANTSAPNGFKVVRRQDGAAWTGNQTARLIAAANTHKFYNGDVVVSLNTGYIDTATAGTTQIAGVFVGCEYLSTALGRVVWSPQFPGGDTTQDVTAYIIDDPAVLFEVQSGNGGPVTKASIGNNINFATGSGNTLSGQSTAYADFASIATTSTLPFRIVALVTDPPGVNGSDATTAYNNILVAFNNQDFKSLTGI